MTTTMNNIDLNGSPVVGEALTATAGDSTAPVSDVAVVAPVAPATPADIGKPTGATTVPAEHLFEAEPPPTEQESTSATDKETYWQQVLTANPATVPTEVRDRCGANDAGLSPEQREYRLCGTINRSWMADHGEHSRRELMVNWGKYRAELAKELGVADDEREVFVALSVREGEAARRALAHKVYEQAYYSALLDEGNFDISAHTRELSPEDSQLAAVIAENALQEGELLRNKWLPLAQDLADSFDLFYAVEDDFFSLPAVLSSAPGLVRAVDSLGELSSEDRQLVSYLAADLHRKKRVADDDAPDDESLASRTVRAFRRGSSRLGHGIFQAVNHAGVATLDNIGERLGGDMGESLRQSSAAWDKRLQVLNEIRHLAQQGAAPLTLPGAGEAEIFFLESAQSVPSAIVSCMGGAGLVAMTLTGMGDSVAEARRRAPEGSQKEQFVAGVVSGTAQGVIYAMFNRMGGFLFNQSLGKFMRARGYGWPNVGLAGIKTGTALTAEGAKLMLAGKVAGAAELAVHEATAQLSGSDSGIDWQLYGASMLDADINMREAAAMLPFLLVGAGRAALRHFRSVDNVLGSGSRLLEWKVEPEKVDAILREKRIDVQNEMLREAVKGSELYLNPQYSADIVRAYRLLNLDKSMPNSMRSSIREFLNLSSDFLMPTAEQLSAATPSERVKAAHTLRREWEQKAALDATQMPEAPKEFGYKNSLLNGAGRKGLMNGRGRYRESYMFQYENPADSYTFLHHSGLRNPGLEAIRQQILHNYSSELDKCSYRILLQLYPQDMMTCDNGVPLQALIADAEKLRRRYLDLACGAVMKLAAGNNRSEVYDALATECGNMLREQLQGEYTAGWLRAAPDELISDIAARCLRYDHKSMQGYDEMKTFYRLIHRTRVCAAVLADFLPMSETFQESLVMGKSPAQVYEDYLRQQLGYESTGPMNAEPIAGSQLRANFEQTSAQQLQLYTTMTGHEVEQSPADDKGQVHYRVMCPDGRFSPWYPSQQALANSIAGNASLLFSPLGTRAEKHIMSDFYNPDSLLTLPVAGEKEYSGFDQLCGLAIGELSRRWLGDATHAQPGLLRKRVYPLDRALLRGTLDMPLVKHVGDAPAFSVDKYAMLTPTGLAYSRFVVYWAQQLNSGIVSAKHLGDFLERNQVISKEQKDEILAIGRRRTPGRKATNAPTYALLPRINKMNIQMAEHMGKFTFLYFLGRMPQLDLPPSVLNWYGSQSFAPDIPRNDGKPNEDGKQFIHGHQDEHTMSWINGQTGVRLRELAPQVQEYRAKYGEQVGDSLVDELLPAAFADDTIVQLEQGWTHYLNGDEVFSSAGQHYWNLLRFPARSWEQMLPEYRHDIALELEKFCRDFPSPVPLLQADGNPFPTAADATIANLDTMLQLYPQLHRVSYMNSDSGRLIELRPQAFRPILEPAGRLLGWNEENEKIRADYKVGVTNGRFLTEGPPELKYALHTLDFLRAYPKSWPAYTPDGSILWNHRRYGGTTGRHPRGLERWTPQDCLLDMRNMLWREMSYAHGTEQTSINCAGVEIPLLSLAELECPSLRDITVYRHVSHYPRQSYRLMPGVADSALPALRLPYVVGVRYGVYLGENDVTDEDMAMSTVPESSYKPLQNFAYKGLTIPFGRYKNLLACKRRIVRSTLEELWTLADDGPQVYTLPLAVNGNMPELLMRLFEDTDFSKSLRGKTIEELDVGSLYALRLGADMISCVAAPDFAGHSEAVSAYERLKNTADSMREHPERIEKMIESLVPHELKQREMRRKKQIPDVDD